MKDENSVPAAQKMTDVSLFIFRSKFKTLRIQMIVHTGLSEREKLHIEADYYNIVTGDLIKAQRSAEVGAQTYPRDPDFLASLILNSRALGQYEEALKESLERFRLYPYNSRPPPYRSVASTYLCLNRVEEAETTVKEAHAKGLDFRLAPVLYGIAFYRNDAPEMARQAASAADKMGDEDWLLALEADTAAYFGHVGKAREFVRQAAGSAGRVGEKERAATYYAVSALREALFGNTDRAGRQAILAKGRASGRDMDYGLALALAYAGDAGQAQALADDLGKRFPEDTVVQFNYLPTLRAKLELLHSLFLGPLLLMNWGWRRLTITTGPACIPYMCVEKPILPHIGAAKRQQSFRKSSAIVALF